MEMKKNGSDEKMKAIMKDMVVGGGSQGQKTFEVSSCLLLDSKLSNNNDDNEYPCRKVNLPNYYLNIKGAGSSSCSHHRHIDEAQEETPPEPTYKVFTCNFCKREFSTCQALGGHQSAHKQERAIAKWRKGTGVGDVGHPSFHPYNPFSIGYDSSLINRSPLGVRMDSRIHKPSFYPWSSSTSSLGHRFGHGAWSRASSISNRQQPSIVRVNTGNNNGRCDVVGSSASRLEGSGRSLLDTASSSALVATNVAASNKVTGGDGLLWRSGPWDEKEVDAPTEIDLSLRL